MSIENLEKSLTMIDDAMSLLSSGPMSFYARKIREINDEFFKRCCPFIEGDRVRLKQTPEITENKNHGWIGSKHYLVAGAEGTVREKDFYKGKFRFMVEIDNQTWTDTYGVKRVRSDPALYNFPENMLENES